MKPIDSFSRFSICMALVVMIFTLFASTALAGEGWLVDYKKAKAKAAKEGKDILIDFTGSDWCPPCIALKKNVLSKNDFKAEANKNFVLLELDYPRGEKALAAQAPEIKAQNAELQNRFSVQIFPTILLADAEGRPYAMTGYEPGGPKSYLEHLAKLSKKKAAREKALNAVNGEGVERAKQLHAALQSIQANMESDGRSAKNLVIGTYDNVVSEIIKLDAKDKAKLKSSYLASLRLMEVSASLQKLLADNSDAELEVLAVKVGDFIEREKLTGESLQLVLFMKGQIIFAAEKKDEAKKLFIEAQKAAPKSETAKQIGQILKQFFGKKDSL